MPCGVNARTADPAGTRTGIIRLAREENRLEQNTAVELPDQSGRVVIITGANSGLGLAAAHRLASKGATVVLGCRSVPNAEKARAAILAVTPRANVEVGSVDVASLRSVRDFAETIRRRFSVLDVLINNAGIMATPRAVSSDGFEMQFATNHLGHFALTGLLLPLMRERKSSRVVAVASIAARSGRIDFDDPMGERRYDAWQAYNQSKLANLMFALELQRRLAKMGSATVAVAAHPGASTTNLFATPGGYFAKRVMSPLMSRFAVPVGRARGAADPARGRVAVGAAWRLLRSVWLPGNEGRSGPRGDSAPRARRSGGVAALALVRAADRRFVSVIQCARGRSRRPLSCMIARASAVHSHGTVM